MFINLCRLFLIVGFLSNDPASFAQNPGDEALFNDLTNATGAKSIAALDTVLKTSETCSSMFLYMGAVVAMREQRLEDAGFLFYIAKLRGRIDMAIFPPVGTGGNSPGVALAAMNQQIGEPLNPAIMRSPKVFAAILEKVKIWKPKFPEGYNPGWDFTKKEESSQVEKIPGEYTKKFLDGMAGFSALLLDDTYFAAFKVMQDYNLKVGEKDRPSQVASDKALEIMKKIEKEKGIDGFGSIK